jgi:hypothetical protein
MNSFYNKKGKRENTSVRDGDCGVRRLRKEKLKKDLRESTSKILDSGSCPEGQSRQRGY